MDLGGPETEDRVMSHGIEPARSDGAGRLLCGPCETLGEPERVTGVLDVECFLSELLEGAWHAWGSPETKKRKG
jgi:hypothetical protein